jgi:LysR family positive regulator for ilvC
MDFFQIEAFLALSETKHFSRAAAIIHLSPSALSRMIGRLEEELGVILFERDTRRVSLTEDGETFLAFARETIHNRDDLRLQIGKRDGHLRGILRIYASVTACYSILPPFVEALNSGHPELRLSVETGDPADAVDAVREGRVELALGAIPPEGFPDLQFFSVKKSPLVFVSSSTGPYRNLDISGDHSRNLEMVLGKTPLILPKTGLARERFNRWTRTHGIKPSIVAETEGNEAILALGRLGLGLGFVPRIVLENSPFADGMKVYNSGEDFGDYDIGFVQKTGDTGSESVRSLRMVLSDVIQHIYPV